MPPPYNRDHIVHHYVTEFNELIVLYDPLHASTSICTNYILNYQVNNTKFEVFLWIKMALYLFVFTFTILRSNTTQDLGSCMVNQA